MVQALARFASVHVMAIGDPASSERREAAAHLSPATLEVFAATGPDERESAPLETTRPPDALAHFRSPALTRALAERVSREAPDAAHFEELVMAQYATQVSCPRVLDRQKIEWAYHESCAEAAGIEAAWHRAEAARLRRFEHECLTAFDRVIVTGAGDARLLPAPASERAEVIAIAVDDGLTLSPSRTSAVDHVLLYGALDYLPNVEAIATCLRDVWPRLREAQPALRLVIAGSGTLPQQLRATDPRIEVRGFVEDVGGLLRGPGVLLVPLRIGGGIRVKILEALACGMPVVSTAVGAENLGLIAGQHYLSAETALEMAEAILRLSRDARLVESLGRAGAARVDEAFRASRIAGQVEALYRGVAGRRRPRPGSKTRALLIGVYPWPRDVSARQLSFPGHRSEQFAWSLRESGCDVETALLNEEGAGSSAADGIHLLAPERFRAGQDLQRLHDAFRPDVVVAAGGLHPARAAVSLSTSSPRWVDLPGDLAAEAQLRAARSGDGALPDYHAVLDAALAVGDRFSVVGPSQRLALLGQLGLAGRLTADAVGREPIAIVPLAVDGPEPAPALPEGKLRVAWIGGYNTWMDVETVFRSLEAAMERRDDIEFVATGGAVPGHEPEAHAALWECLRSSRFSHRCVDHGRLQRERAREVLASSHVVLCLSVPCAEAELGSRLRIVEAMASGRAVILTALGDIARDVQEAGAGVVVPPRDPRAVAAALVDLAASREALAGLAARGRQLWKERFTYAVTTPALSAWLRAPERWPGSGIIAPAAAERLRLQAELDALRGSLTFRMLRRLDRLLGRG
jgi:glycosyltransferase involved in cell wall biosynthesis